MSYITDLQTQLTDLVANAQRSEFRTAPTKYKLAKIVEVALSNTAKIFSMSIFFPTIVVLSTPLNFVAGTMAVCIASIPLMVGLLAAHDAASKVIEARRIPTSREREKIVAQSLDFLSTFKDNGGQLKPELGQALAAAMNNDRLSMDFWEQTNKLLSNLSVAQCRHQEQNAHQENLQDAISEFQKDFGLEPQASSKIEVVDIEPSVETKLSGNQSAPSQQIKL